jgi:hypothetical protein
MDATTAQRFGHREGARKAATGYDAAEAGRRGGLATAYRAGRWP